MKCIHVTPQYCKTKELDMVLVKGQMKQKNEGKEKIGGQATKWF